MHNAILIFYSYDTHDNSYTLKRILISISQNMPSITPVTESTDELNIHMYISSQNLM